MFVVWNVTLLFCDHWTEIKICARSWIWCVSVFYAFKDPTFPRFLLFFQKYLLVILLIVTTEMQIAARISSKSIIQSQLSDQKQWFRWFCRFYFSKVLRLAQIKFIQWAIPPFFCSSNYLNRYKMQISRFWFSYMLQANVIILLNTVDRFNRIGFLDIVTNH